MHLRRALALYELGYTTIRNECVCTMHASKGVFVLLDTGTWHMHIPDTLCTRYLCGICTDRVDPCTSTFLVLLRLLHAHGIRIIIAITSNSSIVMFSDSAF